jgi:DNA-directed RNA polymerase specialized sigma24 family protein
VELSEKPGRHGDLSPAAAPVSGEAALLKQDMRQRVVMLSRSGFSASLIAARVGIPLGEVELIISLERQRMSQPASRNEGQT